MATLTDKVNIQTYAKMYDNKIVVHPDAVRGDGYFHKGNWSRIFFQHNSERWLDRKYPVDEHYVELGFGDDDDGMYHWKAPVTLAQLEGTKATIVDLPESFDTIKEYLDWCKDVGIKITEEQRLWICSCEGGGTIEYRVMRNYNGVHAFPGQYYIMTKKAFPAKMLDGGTHEHAVRCYNGKRCYQTFYGSRFPAEAEELYQILRTIPDLTEKEMHDFGIKDFG